MVALDTQDPVPAALNPTQQLIIEPTRGLAALKLR
jgi:hypothetical protein